MRSPSWERKSMGAESASAEMTGVTMPTLNARNQYAFAMSRQLCTSPAVWMTDSMPEYAARDPDRDDRDGMGHAALRDALEDVRRAPDHDPRALRVHVQNPECDQ